MLILLEFLSSIFLKISNELFYSSVFLYCILGNYIERQVKSILRKSKPSSSPLTSKQSSSLDGITETTQSLTSSLSQSNSVRFHPLALLLDAALEGDLELVKKAASEVSEIFPLFIIKLLSSLIF